MSFKFSLTLLFHKQLVLSCDLDSNILKFPKHIVLTPVTSEQYQNQISSADGQ
ncbi:hypothetical protein SynRS9902_01186 [Synechococcus sp. RS9902]|nr:hypothetical protein SynRS9902_01186 [Synechococcus sp. RS9902]